MQKANWTMPYTLGNRVRPVINRIILFVPGIASRAWGGLVMAFLALALGSCESSNSSDASDGTVSPDAYAITVYYTAVESFHGGVMETVRGLLSPEGAFGNDVLGTYPASFIAAVQAQGAGRITSG